MDLILLVVALAVIGFLIYLLITYVPMPPMWKTAIQVIAVVVLVLYLLTRFIPIPNVLP